MVLRVVHIVIDSGEELTFALLFTEQEAERLEQLTDIELVSTLPELCSHVPRKELPV
jgi:hypothetical protein